MIKSANQPENSNPWYILMTLHGEQTCDTIDWDLHRKNMNTWNRFVGSIINSSLSMELHRQSDLRDELKLLIPASFSEAESREIHEDVAVRFSVEKQKRTGTTMAGPRMPKKNEAKTIDFSNLKFEKVICCKGFLFHLPVTIENCVLKKKVIYQDAIFAAGWTINDSNFELHLNLSGSYHHKHLNIYETLFGSHSAMNNCQFSSAVSFRSAAFSAGLSISESVFSEDVTILSCNVDRHLDFTHSKFASRSEFVLCTLGGVDFNHVEFNKNMGFSHNKVDGAASFLGARFGGLTFFSETKFIQGVSFQTTQFDRHSYFTRCKFSVLKLLPKEDISFENCTFLAPVSFQDSYFENRYPVLTGVSLPEVNHFPADDKYWPITIDQSPREVAATCAAIRNSCAKQGLHDEEHFFFRREMDSKGKDGRLMYKLPFAVFKAVSNYGYSIARPTICLLYLWAFGFATYWGYLLGCCFPRPCGEIDHPLGTAIGFSLSNVFPVFGFRKIYFSNDFMDCLPASLIFLSSAQTVLSLPFIFFLGLGIRQRFRLR